MTSGEWQSAWHIYDAARELPSGEQRAFVESKSADPDISRQVFDLLSSLSDEESQPAEASDSNRTGAQVGRYHVSTLLGRGGMGEVYAARDMDLDRPVALKFLRPEGIDDPTLVERFLREAKAASALNHPNIVTIHEVIDASAGRAIAMELVEGDDLRPFSGVAQPAERVVQIGQQIARALAAAHGAGLIHRDIKPENILVRKDGYVKIVDFGLARRVASETTEQGVSGSIRYMSPEQARGEVISPASDIFSFGLVLYEIATGQHVFPGASPIATMEAILTGTPDPPCLHNAAIPTELNRLIVRMLAKDAAARPGAEEVARILADVERAMGTRTARPWARAGVWAAMLALTALGALAIAVVFSIASRRPAADSFKSMRIRRVVTRGEARDTAISADGKLLGYVVSEPPGQSIWVRRLTSSDETAAVAPEAAEHSGLVFSRDGAFVYYRRRGAGKTGDLYRVRSGGGPAERVLGDVSGAVAISPDGKRLAFVRLNVSTWEASLIVANADGSGEYTLATARRPNFLDQNSIAWSPDGRSIVCFTGQAMRYSEAGFRLVEIQLSDRMQRSISSQVWAWPRSVAWAEKGDVLVVNAASRGDDVYQLWTVRRGDGHIERLTNDLSTYGRVTITADGGTLATTQEDTSAAMWVAPQGDSARAVRVSGNVLRSSHVDVAWTSGGKIVYAEPTGDYRNIWLMDSDGRNRRQLTAATRNQDQISITRDGRYILYAQNGNIWRVDGDGRHPVQLTTGALDVHPDVSPDGQTVVYTSFADWSPAIGGEPTLWKIPVEGGTAIQVARHPASQARVSPDGKRIGCVYFPGKDPRFSANHLAVLGLDESGSFRVFESSPSGATTLSWSPDGQALDFVINQGGVGNIWRQPMDGRPAARVTNFTADELYKFSWSRDGRLVAARGTTAKSVVMIENFR